MRTKIMLLIILFSVSLSATAAEIPADKEILTFPGKLGNVTFLHKLHSQLENVGGVQKVECGTCHHTYKGEGAVKACSECHTRDRNTAAASDAPKLKDAFHVRCRSCHKYTMEQGKHAGPDKKCKLCHVK